jgi:hypothetical protein
MEAVDAVDVYVLGQASFGKLLFLLLRPLVVGLVLFDEADGFEGYFVHFSGWYFCVKIYDTRIAIFFLFGFEKP